MDLKVQFVDASAASHQRKSLKKKRDGLDQDRDHQGAHKNAAEVDLIQNHLVGLYVLHLLHLLVRNRDQIRLLLWQDFSRKGVLHHLQKCNVKFSEVHSKYLKFKLRHFAGHLFPSLKDSRTSWTKIIEDINCYVKWVGEELVSVQTNRELQNPLKGER